MSLMGKCCCGCYTACECLPSTITLRIPAYTNNIFYNNYSPYTVSYSAQDVVLYKCCFLQYGDKQSTFLYRSNGIPSGTVDVYSSYPPYGFLYTRNLYSFFLVYSKNTPNNYSKCCWYFSAHIGVSLPLDYITFEKCGTYNDMNNACPTTVGERFQASGGSYDSFNYKGRIYFWTQTAAPYGCSITQMPGNNYYLSRCVGEGDESPVANCVIGPSPYTLLGDNGIPDITGIEIL